MKIAVIGAGPAGLSAAYVLTKNGYNVDIYEATSQVGGMSKSLNLWNQTVDIGPHRFFSKDKKVNELWMEVVKEDFNMVNRLTRILYKNKFFLYPINLINALSNLGFIEALRCLISYLLEIIIPTKQDSTFEAWVRHRFGKRLYEIFFKTYSEKLWGISCCQLDSDFASQRIKKLSFFEAIQNALFTSKDIKHATLLDRFAYPTKGAGMVYQKMTDYITAQGNNIYYNTPANRVLTKEKKVTGIELFNGEIKEYDQVISTMPYTLLVNNLKEAPLEIKAMAGQLKYRNTIIVYLLINATDAFKDNWIYVHSKELSMGRITNFRNWVPSLYGKEKKSVLAIEYWSNDCDNIWVSKDEEMISMASSEIVRTCLVNAERIESGYVLRIDKSYPVYFKGYKEFLSPIVDYTNSIKGLSTIGRNGSYKYNNQDHSILMGILAAENIVFNKNIDLSKINSDYENYQESSKLSETGLITENK